MKSLRITLATKKCVPNGFLVFLSENCKKKQLRVALTFLERYPQESDTFVNHVVTDDDTWGSHKTSETKCQSMDWHYSTFLTTKKN